MKKTMQIITSLLLSFTFLLFLTVNSFADSQDLLREYRKDLDKIEKHLNGINSLVANFNQTTEYGEKSEGMFYLKKPGKLRWEYYGSDPLIIVTSGKTVTHYDVELDQISYFRVDNKLTSFLTKKNISFNDEDITIKNIVKNDNLISITLSDPENDYVNDVTLQFTLDKIAIDSILIRDSTDNSSLIEFESIEYDKPLDKKLFLLSKFS